jgi:hypothetical protein
MYSHLYITRWIVSVGSRPGVMKRLGTECHKCQKFKIKIVNVSVGLLGSGEVFCSLGQLGNTSILR